MMRERTSCSSLRVQCQWVLHSGHVLLLFVVGVEVRDPRPSSLSCFLLFSSTVFKCSLRRRKGERVKRTGWGDLAAL